jgi:GH24 family phage-related lysozyme (muramidase)
MKLVKEHINDDNFYFELLNESLNEELNIDSIKQIISKISDKAAAISRLIKKFNESRNMHARKYIASILIVMFLINFVGKNNRWSSTASDIPHVEYSRVEKLALKLMKQDNITLEKIKTEVLPLAKKTKPELIKANFITLSSAHASDSAKNFIKHHEKLNLEAYSIGDGMITIGYGHAYPEKKSKYKVGNKITKEKAEELFAIDIQEAEDGVKDIIKKWKNPKREAQLTQGMFDAMVSMAYNMGNVGLKNTDFMNYIKDGKFKTAAEKIKTTKIKSTINKNGENVLVEMPGLKIRRLAEYKLFASK